MKYLFTIFAILIAFNSWGQLKEFSSFYDKKSLKDNNEGRTIKKFRIKVDKNHSLLIKNKLVYQPLGDSVIKYEIFDKRYVFISAYDSSYNRISMGATVWPKANVYIISIKNPSQYYYANFEKRANSNGILQFSEEKKEIQFEDRKTKEINVLKVLQR